MLKWILGGIAVLILALAGTCYYGYNKLTSGGDTVITTIGASPERVFATLATPDSMALWMADSRVEAVNRGAVVAAGDTLRFHAIKVNDEASGTKVAGDWVVREVRAPHLLVMEMTSDSGGRTSVVLVRRDSLVAVGDSTAIHTTFSTPLFDSVSTTVRDSSKLGGSILGGAAKMMVGVMRLSTEQELQGLKRRVEGRP